MSMIMMICSTHRSPSEATTKSAYPVPYSNPNPQTYTTRYDAYTYSTQATPYSMKITTNHDAINNYNKLKNSYSPPSVPSSRVPYVRTTTAKKTNNYYNYNYYNVYATATSTVRSISPSKFNSITSNALQQKISPFKYKTTSSATVIASSVTGNTYGQQSTAARGKKTTVSENIWQNHLADWFKLKIFIFTTISILGMCAIRIFDEIDLLLILKSNWIIRNYSHCFYY